MSTFQRARGLWYFVVVVLSMGIFTAVPFAHAAIRSRKPALWRWFAVYGAVTVAAFVILPTRDAPSDLRSGIGSLTLITMMIVACFHLARVRREVYGLPEPYGAPAQPAAPWSNDPAVAAALALRARREEARALVERDPVLARDLRIGRPDLPRQYDDGGLVDVNAAPGPVIAQYCGVDMQTAKQIETARDRHLSPFVSVDEMLVFAEVDINAWDRIRERGVVLP
ncbi:hypothetical protein [Actinosynnema sp. NPDC020468]|uniref:hypothetical protein n=1 Tax=Actinosynnema sp. NPDC020468 TaxID=3154488 RepID=UPI00340C897A